MVSGGVKGPAAGAARRRAAARVAQELVGVGGVVAARGPRSSVFVLPSHRAARQLTSAVHADSRGQSPRR